MAEEQDTERHLPASQKRLDDAREHGQVPRSRELTTALLLLAAAAVFAAAGPALLQGASDFLGKGLSVPQSAAFDADAALRRSGELMGRGFLVAVPVFAVLFVAALLTPLLIGGWMFTFEPVTPDFSRLNPLKGIGNLFSVQSLAELLKSLAKVSLVGMVAFGVLASHQAETAAYAGMAPAAAVASMGDLITHDFLVIAAALLAVAVADVPLQIWRHGRGLRMSADEVKREARESDGDPQVKSRIRQRQREAARRRMMSAVPTADVVVTNPSHYAVALSYQAPSMRAPRVVAKGRDEVAAKIREIAAQNGVPLLEAPPLARALYAHAEIDAEIPAALYNAVAQVLAYVYQLRLAVAGRMPAAPSDLEVPAELDPQHPASLKAASQGAPA
jgi:flagellar biosynthetic protein FlhB